jgi:hypothetical protein
VNFLDINVSGNASIASGNLSRTKRKSRTHDGTFGGLFGEQRNGRITG